MFVVLWLLCSFICAAIAASKGRSAVGWFFLGLIGGVFAVLAIACLSKVELIAAQATFSFPEKTCPKCAENVKEAALVCRFCGHEFAPEVETPLYQS